VEGFEDDQKVDVYINHTFPNGTDNRIKWRAKDLAGNGPVESPRYLINVNTWIPVRTPKVTLLSPPKDIKINTTQVELSWELEDISMENVTYDIYFDVKSPPEILERNETNTSYFIDKLENGITYYWRVLPRVGNLEGVCNSGIWWFKIDLNSSEVKDIFDVRISCRELISLYPGENNNITITITNLGKVDDNIKLEIDANKVSDYLTLDDYSILQLGSADFSSRTLRIALPDTAQPGIYSIVLTAISMNSGAQEKDSKVLILEIKEPEQPGPGVNGNETNGTKLNETLPKNEKTSDDIMAYLISAIVIIIILILALVGFVLKRKKHSEQELIPTGAFAIKPGSLPAQVITLDQIPAATVAAQLPVVTITGAQPLASTAEVPQLVRSTQVAQVAVPQPTTTTPQLPQLPQLPPAQIQEMKPEASAIIPEPTVVSLQPVIPEIVTPQVDLKPKVTQTASESSGPTVHLPGLTPTQITTQKPEITTNKAPFFGEPSKFEKQPDDPKPTAAQEIKPQLAQQTQIQPTINYQSQQNLCITCNQPLTYYSQNSKYYCHHCQKYM
jgi:hypothetical protein